MLLFSANLPGSGWKLKDRDQGGEYDGETVQYTAPYHHVKVPSLCDLPYVSDSLGR